MTPVAHSLVGATVGVLYCNDRRLPVRTQMLVIAGVVFCANLPDCPLPGWGHSRYEISHSIFIGMFLVIGYVVVTRWLLRDRILFGAWPLIAAGTSSLYSHYLLDSFYSHGKGIAIFWPFSEARLALPIPWFETMKIRPLLCWHNISIWGIELLWYGTLLLAVLLLSHWKGNGDSDGLKSRQ